ncbi:receptor-like protein EIX1 isoform X3 [Medicago truncatula]|uniref:receptor-like protein EIX1 isoform X3 n=1 Tax=Medicago truncatula TaxID=3880 RepID=UPI0019675267|nr:receptor-like protein EIX1 isoform X3 [Medicago truncatula]
MTTMSIMNQLCFKLIQIIFLMCLLFQAYQLVCSKEVVRCIQSERQALLQFKAGLIDEYDNMLSSWTTEDCCQWKGIGCSNVTGHVIMLDLHGNYDHYNYDYNYHISGDIHKSLMELQQLQYLNFSRNNFEGNSIPGFFGSLRNLRYLDLSYCYFRGQIPIQLESLSHLKYLNLSYNLLDGLIPHRLGDLSNLQFLDLSNNYLEGSIPSQLGKLTNLQELYLSGLTIDNEDHNGGQWLSNLTSLTHLHMWSISNLNKSNSWLKMVGKLPNLRELSLRYCDLSDHFIHSLSQSKFNFSTSLSILDLSWNNFASSLIFQWVSNISSNLVELDLSVNDMVDLPSNSFSCSLPKLRELRLSWNKFTSFMILHSLSNISSNLVELDLSQNRLEDPPSYGYGTVMNSLQEIDLSYNKLKGVAFKSFMNVCTLRSLNLIQNNFTEDLQTILRNLSSGCVRNSLQVLDLSSNGIIGTLPDLSAFTSLKTLDLSSNQLTGEIPGLQTILRNLSSGCVRNSLQVLDLSSNGIIGTLPDLSAFTSLKTLDLSSNQLTGEIPGLQTILRNLSSGCVRNSLQVLDLSDNRITGTLPDLSAFTSLKTLYLSSNQLTGEIPGLQTILRNLSSGCVRNSLQVLDLSDNRITGTLPDLSAFTSLKTLDLSSNQLSGEIPGGSSLPYQLEHLSITSNTLEGVIPKSFWMNACKLKSLKMSNNSFSGELQVIIHHLSRCARYSLQELDLSSNKINGTLPDLSIFSFLEIFDISENSLNGKISEDIRFPTKLRTLQMSSNSMNGVISEFHFSGMSMLKELDLSDNSLALRFTENWVPPFQLNSIGLRSSKLGLTFPKWIQTQKYLLDLDISKAGISDNVPEWFWAKLSSQECNSINISNNNLKGSIPNLQVKNHCSLLSLSSNEFEGPIPAFLQGSALIDLSKNKFSDSRPFLCANGINEILAQFDVSNNQLSGRIPDCWSNFKSLVYVDLSHNNFSGKIPTSMGSLVILRALLLRNNNLTGEIPFSLMNCTQLVMLDMRDNRLEGHIPYWIGSELKELQVLSLKGNYFFGSLPLELCHLQFIQFFDLSLNSLSGRIPKCIKNLTSMTQKDSSDGFTYHFYFIRSEYAYELNALLTWKGVEHVFNNNGLVLLKVIDLSSNHFSEEIPPEIADLIQLVSLNLSRNNFTGKIPSNIGNLTSLDSLDLSRNKLLGSIPPSLSQIDWLSVLDLSHNQLSGEIPTSTQLQSFNATSYEDNLDLCGPPLVKLCTQGEPPHDPKEVQDDEDLLLNRGFYISLTFGFIIGFWGVFGSILIKRSWRHAYFKFMNNLVDNIYVKCR